MAGEMAEAKPDIMQFGSNDNRLATSLDLTKQENKKIIMNALQECDAKLVEQVNKRIRIRDYVVHDVTKLEEKTGELIPLVRLVVIDELGCTYECTSVTLLNSMQRLAWVFGKPPWNPPLEVEVKHRKKNNRDIYWFNVD